MTTSVFWGVAVAMVLMNLVFLWPLYRTRHRFVVYWAVLFMVGSYGAYRYWDRGQTAGLAHYYSDAERAMREKQAAMRPLLMQFRKAEQRYLLRTEVDPNDREAWLNLAQIYLIQQDEARANEAFLQAQRIVASSLDHAP